MNDITIKTVDGKFVCTVWGTHFRVTQATVPGKTGNRMLDDLNQGRYENGILYAYRNKDGTFETDVDCGGQRFLKTRGPRATGNGLRRLGFNQKQVSQILDATKIALGSPVAC